MFVHIVSKKQHLLSVYSSCKWCDHSVLINPYLLFSTRIGVIWR